MDQALNIEKFNEFNLLKKDVEEAGWQSQSLNSEKGDW